MQMRSHSRFPFSRPLSRDFRNPRPRLVCRFRRIQSPGQMTGHASSGCGRRHPAVAGPLRGDVGVHTQRAQTVNCLGRVVPASADTSIGAAPVLPMVSSSRDTACCLSDVRLVARAATITWWTPSTTAWQL